MMRRQNNTLDGYDVLDFGTNTYDGKRLRKIDALRAGRSRGATTSPRT